MKVFWSWQSDTWGKIGRHFVREALDGAIADLKEPPDIDEPTREAQREAIHLDSDRQGVSGSPDLAATIFSKIAAAAVVVADVTPVGHAPARRSESGEELPAKALMNPNVAIELGYTLGKHADEAGNRLLMVCNKHYGERSDLPFDLAHKAGPIFFNLSPASGKDDIVKAGKQLRRDLATALKPFLSVLSKTTEPVFQSTSTGANSGVWFSTNDALGSFGDARFGESVVHYRMELAPIYYLRLIPTNKPKVALTRSKLAPLGHKLPFFSMTGGFHLQQNIWGIANVEPSGSAGLVKSVAQLFLNGEIWAIQSIFSFKNELGHTFFSYLAFENLVKQKLYDYLDLIINNLDVSLPIIIEVGFIGVEGSRLMVSQLESVGPVYKEAKAVRVQFNVDGVQQRNNLLLNIFQNVYSELVQEDRPKNFNGLTDLSSSHQF